MQLKYFKIVFFGTGEYLYCKRKMHPGSYSVQFPKQLYIGRNQRNIPTGISQKKRSVYCASPTGTGAALDRGNRLPVWTEQYSTRPHFLKISCIPLP